MPIALAALTGAAAAQQPALTFARAAPAAKPDAALKGDDHHTRFIIGLEDKVEFQVFSLTDPNRVYVDLPDIKLELPALSGNAPVGLIKSFRFGQSAPGKTRIVIDVTGPVIVDKASVQAGRDGSSARLVIDIVAASPEAAADMKAAQEARRVAMQAGATGLGAASLMQPPLPRPAVSPQARAQGMFKPIIVLDPGHGGMDSGAVKLGTIEKDVVLAFSLKLREKLQATGRYKVLMTRDTDTFIELNARREFAERNTAALFVAVHADYAHAKARGATIYSLRENVAQALQRSAKGEVAANVLSAKTFGGPPDAEGDIGTVKEILADLAQREVDRTRDRTNVFVKSVIEFMGGSTGMKDNPDRTAAFVVLKSAKVPSILIELGYVTNEADAQQLKSEEWREKVSTSITTAIENYFSYQLARLPM